ncbi:MAG: N-acetylmuramic acid 6-phosphate etherase [Flavobacteriales bacterium]
MIRITESTSEHDHLETLTTRELLNGINAEDTKVATAVEHIIPQIEAFVNACYQRMSNGGRLFYLGAGTSGRLGIVDASECPPTFGVDHGVVIGLIAGGDHAIRKAVEFAEDDEQQGWKDLEAHQINELDTLVGIAASGTTPYVMGAIRSANAMGILTGGITCNPGAPLAMESNHPMVPVVGPEFVTGSTRMKSGTAQKMVLNMISTSLMIKLGHVKGNKMVDMQLSNEKLVQRAVRMVCDEIPVSEAEATTLLSEYKSVRASIDAYHVKNNNK